MTYQNACYHLWGQVAKIGRGVGLSFWDYCRVDEAMMAFFIECMLDPIPLEKDLDMTTKKKMTPAEKAGTNAKKTPYNKKRYVKVDLTPSDRPKIMSLSDDPHQMMVLADDVIKAGYTIRTAYNPDEGVVSVYVDGDKTSANKGLVLESHGSNYALVLAVSLYKVVVLRDFGAWDKETRDGDWFS